MDWLDGSRQVTMAKISDFIIAGKRGNLNRWPFHAMSMRCLWCYHAERENGPMCDTCRKPGYCALTTEFGLLKVVPIQTAPNFMRSDDYELLLVTASKVVGSVDVEKVRRQLAQLVFSLGEGVLLFKSSIDLRGETEWVRCDI